MATVQISLVGDTNPPTLTPSSSSSSPTGVSTSFYVSGTFTGTGGTIGLEVKLVPPTGFPMVLLPSNPTSPWTVQFVNAPVTPSGQVALLSARLFIDGAEVANDGPYYLAVS